MKPWSFSGSFSDPGSNLFKHSKRLFWMAVVGFRVRKRSWEKFECSHMRKFSGTLPSSQHKKFSNGKLQNIYMKLSPLPLRVRTHWVLCLMNNRMEIPENISDSCCICHQHSPGKIVKIGYGQEPKSVSFEYLRTDFLYSLPTKDIFKSQIYWAIMRIWKICLFSIQSCEFWEICNYCHVED